MKKAPEQPRSQKLAVRLRELTFTGAHFLAFKQQAPGAATRLRLDVDEETRDGVDGLLVRLTTGVLAHAQRRQVTTHKQVPATWWDHLKATIRPHLPIWLFKRVHVTYAEIERTVTITETRVCPHLPYANRQDHDSFLAFVDPPATPAADGVHLREPHVPPIVCLVGTGNTRRTAYASTALTNDGAIVLFCEANTNLDRQKIDLATAVVVVDDDGSQAQADLYRYALAMGKPISVFSDQGKSGETRP